MKETQLPILESFLRAPDAHEVANADPAMAGGPFVDLPASSAERVKELCADTQRRFGALGELADAIHALARHLRDAKGLALESVYAEVPRILRGRVELVYDLDHRACLRLIEPLLYRADELRPELGQSVQIRRWPAGRRPFVLSTPRLPVEEAIDLDVPFSSDVMDDLSAARWSHVDVPTLAERIGVSTSRLASLMTAAPIPGSASGQRESDRMGRQDTSPPSGARVRYFGHATLLFESQTTTVLLDPVLTFAPDHGPQWRCKTGHELPPSIDVIALTHAHLDHISIESLLLLRNRVGVVVVPKSAPGELQDPGLRHILNNVGFDHVVEVSDFEKLRVGDVELTAIPFLGEHGDLRISAKTGYAIAAGDKQVVAVADSRNLEGSLYRQVREQIGPVDTVFVGMECVGAPMTWLYEALHHDPIDRSVSHSRRLAGSDSEQALDLVERLEASSAYVYAMGVEPWVWHLTTVTEDEGSPQIVEAEAFVQKCRARGIESKRLRGADELLLR